MAKVRQKAQVISQFQREVYRAVSQIPLGQVRSYGWVAKKIKRPKAVRAVGTALKNNPFAPIIPCHRVISSDGSLGGYSRGLKEKIKLLRLEQEIIKSRALQKQNRRQYGT